MAAPAKGRVKRRIAGTIVAAGVLLLSHGLLSSLGAHAQQADKLPRVGVISIAPLTSPHYRAFLQGLHDFGYVDGKNIAIIARSAEGNPDRYPELARELVHLRFRPRDPESTGPGPRVRRGILDREVVANQRS